MATVVLDAYSKAYPAITNRIKASVTLSNDVAIVASIIDTTAGHPARIYHFPGLPRANYAFSLDEIDGGGAVVQNLAKFDVVPGQIDGTLVRDDEQIRVGTTTGFDADLNTVTFDGTGGKPNYIGWNIVPSELTGRGILVRGLDYSWDSITGVFTLLQDGDILSDSTWYNIHFDPIINPAGGSVATINDFTARILSESGNIETSDFGNTLIIEPSGSYLEATLPDILTVPVGRCLTIETVKLRGSNVQCTKILPQGTDVINFLRGNLFMMNNESLQIYRFKRPDESNEWRVRNQNGNFLSCGESVGDDAIQTGVYCKQLFDGSIKDRYQYARIYEEVVLTLPGTQVCNYDDWATGNNKYLYSLANSSDLGNADKFHFPDRRDLFERNNNAGKAGDYSSDSIKEITFNIEIRDGAGGSSTGSINNTGFSGQDNPSVWRLNDTGSGPKYIKMNQQGAGTETKPKNYIINKYVRV